MTASAAVSAEQQHVQQALQAFRHSSASSSPGQVLDLLRAVARHMDARLAEASLAVDELAVKSADLNTRAANAVARRDILSMSKFIEQRIEEDDHGWDAALSDRSTEAAPSEASISAVHSKYRAAFEAGLQALCRADGNGSRPPPLLPHIYGSAEYLGDSSAGLGPPDKAAAGGPGSAVAASERAASQGAALAMDPAGLQSPPSEGGSSDEQPASTVGSLLGPTQGFDRKLPDFKSMLEAALRGDLPPSAAAWAPPAPLSARSRDSAYSDLGASASVVAERFADPGRGRAAATTPSSVVSQTAAEQSVVRNSSEGSQSPGGDDSPDSVAQAQRKLPDE